MKEITQIIGVLILVALAFYIGRIWPEQETTEITFIPLPGPMDIQRQLVELGSDIKVDGKIGPQTLAAWEKQFCEQSAAVHFRD